MGLKCKILLFAASPFNNDQPYAGSASDEANEKHQAWYGNYSESAELRCLTACQEFFNELGTDGYYQLVQAEGTSSGQYRAAFRKGYSSRGTTEMLLSTRVRFRDNWASNYLFQDWNGNGGYTPTAEYMEMFDWKDGRPFDLDKTLAGDPDTMFVNPSKNFELTRDPRLYETMIVKWCKNYEMIMATIVATVMRTGTRVPMVVMVPVSLRVVSLLQVLPTTSSISIMSATVSPFGYTSACRDVSHLC